MGRQHVGVRDLVDRAFKALYLDDAFVGQFSEDVVGFAQADAHPAGHLPLGETGVVGQDFKDFVAYFLFVVTVHAANIRLVGVGCQGEFIEAQRWKVEGGRWKVEGGRSRVKGQRVLNIAFIRPFIIAAICIPSLDIFEYAESVIHFFLRNISNKVMVS